MPAKKPKVSVPCDACGKILERHPYRLVYAKLQFCNAKCRGAWNTQHNRGEAHPRWVRELAVKCDNCGKEFRQTGRGRLKRNKHNFCCAECSTAWMVKNGVYAGENNPAWKEPVRKPCDQCGKMLRRSPNRIGTTERTHHFCNAQCRYAWMSGFMAGENSPVWKGGHIDYYGPNWRKQRRDARKRDGYKCRHCGITQKKLKRALDVHHIISFRSFGYISGENDNYLQANQLDNLISFCQNCHKQAEHGLIPIQPTLLSA